MLSLKSLALLGTLTSSLVQAQDSSFTVPQDCFTLGEKVSGSKSEDGSNAFSDLAVLTSSSYTTSMLMHSMYVCANSDSDMTGI